jgi:uncharacterized membrane-anchored protein
MAMLPGETDLIGPALAMVAMVAMVAIICALVACCWGLRALVRLATGDRRAWRTARRLADEQARGHGEAAIDLDEATQAWDLARRGQP